jgi:hypothetical protein
MSYEGWANYETWAYQLWIFNDETEYGFWTECARRDIERLGRLKAVKSIAIQLDENIQAEIDETNAKGAVLDILTASLQSIDCVEIARALVEAVEPEEEPEIVLEYRKCEADCACPRCRA